MPVKPGAPAIAASTEVAGIMIGAPMYGGVCFDAFLLGVWDLQHECHRLGITLGLCTIRNESLIPRARNRILCDFMESGCSHLIMIDADIGFAARDVLRLVAHDKPLIGGTYAKKDRTRYAPAFVPLPGPVFQREDDGLVEVECLPGGFMCMRRDVVERMREGFPEPWYWDQHGQRRQVHDLFGTFTDLETRQYWSEDYAFCRRWRQLGGQVWLDPYIMLGHNGTTTFDSDPTVVLGEFAPAAPVMAGPVLEPGGSLDIAGQPETPWEHVKQAMGPASYGTASAQPDGAILPTPPALAGLQAVA